MKRFLIGVGALLSWANCAAAQDIEIVNIRVGQGDATLIEGPKKPDGSRVRILFDAGDIADYVGGKVIGAVLAKRGIRTLDYVIVSHYDVDHIGGIVHGQPHGASFLLGWNGTPGATGDDDGDGKDGWLGQQPFFEPDKDEIGNGDDIQVRFFVDRGDADNSGTQAYKKYKYMAESMGQRISLSTQNAIDNYEIDLGNGAKMTALAGNGFVRGKSQVVPAVDTENERSLSFLLNYGKFDFLVSGDMIGRRHGSENAKVETQVGDYIAAKGITVDVLHVDHHGANNGSEASFLEKIKPTIAIISSGNGNDHHHPNKETLARLQAAKVYRIIQTAWGTTEGIMPLDVRKVQAIYQGDIEIRSDGEDYTISTSRTFKTDKNPNRP